MKGLVSLGFKNILRYKRRTIITATAIGMGLMIFILMSSILQGVNRDSEINIIKYEIGEGRITTAVYAEDYMEMLLDETLDSNILNRLEESHLLWTPRIEFPAEMVFNKNPYPVSGYINVAVTAVDSVREHGVFDLNQYVVEGKYPEAGSDGVLVGSWLAEDMGIQVGYPLDLSVQTRLGGEELMELTVVGLLESPNPTVNRNQVIVPMDLAQDYLEMDGLVTQISIKAPRGRTLRQEDVLELEALLQDTNGVFNSWEYWAQDFISIAEGKQTSSGTMLFLIFIIAAVGISNTVLMSIFERVRELGMMRALGLTERDVRLLFLIESGAVGLIGSVVGLIFGALATWGMVTKGIDYTEIIRQQDIGYRITGVMHGIWVPGTMIAAGISGVLICVVIAWLSTRKINRLEITQCLRYQ